MGHLCACAAIIKARGITTGRIASLARNPVGHAVCILALGVLPLLFSSRIDLAFLLSTATLYFSIVFINGISIESSWESFTSHLKALTIAGILFIVVAHARYFGAHQFGKIPQSVGGGQPLSALLVFKEDQQSLARTLEIPQFQSTNSTSTTYVMSTNSAKAPLGVSLTNTGPRLQVTQTSNVFYGPVSILTRSEQEIIFFVPSTNSAGGGPPKALIVRADQIDAIEFIRPSLPR